MSGKFFITGSGTGIGKTLLTCALAHQLRAKGEAVEALKPIISGYIDDGTSDTSLILKSLGMKDTPHHRDLISPWRFAAPLAPNIAAAREGKSIDLGAITLFCAAARKAQILLVEGAGGVMSPLNDTHTNLELMSALNYPAIVVAGTYLGSISHTLTAVESLRARHVPIQAIVVSESEDSALSTQEIADELARFLPHLPHIAQLPRLAGKGDLWHHAPDMTGILA